MQRILQDVDSLTCWSPLFGHDKDNVYHRGLFPGGSITISLQKACEAKKVLFGWHGYFTPANYNLALYGCYS